MPLFLYYVQKLLFIFVIMHQHINNAMLFLLSYYVITLFYFIERDPCYIFYFRWFLNIPLRTECICPCSYVLLLWSVCPRTKISEIPVVETLCNRLTISE